MSDVEFKKHRVFRETQDVIFYDISVEDSNASDLVIHEGTAVSPPNDVVGAKQFYVHYHQVDHNRVVRGERTFELVNPEWTYPYHIVHLNRSSGALVLPRGTWHRSTSGENDLLLLIRQFVMIYLIKIGSLFLSLQQIVNNYMIYY